jgi:hypothetical protein
MLIHILKFFEKLGYSFLLILYNKFDKKKIIVDIDALLERSVGSEGLLDLYCSCHFINYGTSELNVVRLLVQASAPPCSL